MTQPGPAGAGATSELYYRHALPVRLMHWINVLCLTVLFMSGLNIFNAHPALNWGKSSYTGAPPFLEIGARMAGDKIIGVTRIAGREFDTTGVLGAFRNDAGETEPRAFPSWLPVPGTQWLAMAPWLNGVLPGWIDIVGGRQSARTLHFIAAWLLVAFVLVHVFEVIVSGLWNHLRSMITGRYRITVEAGHGQQR